MSEKPKQLQVPQQKPCYLCGHSEFEWGKLIVGKSDPIPFTYFRPYSSSWEDGDIPLYARRCLICQNVLVFTNDN